MDDYINTFETYNITMNYLISYLIYLIINSRTVFITSYLNILNILQA
jgi:hypothetical protein